MLLLFAILQATIDVPACSRCVEYGEWKIPNELKTFKQILIKVTRGYFWQGE